MKGSKVRVNFFDVGALKSPPYGNYNYLLIKLFMRI